MMQTYRDTRANERKRIALHDKLRAEVAARKPEPQAELVKAVDAINAAREDQYLLESAVARALA